MKSRPIAAAFFVALCLLLCGLILRRQIAAHPVPLDAAPHFGEEAHGFSPGMLDMHLAAPPIARQAHQAVQGQLKALHDGDGVAAISYQSHRMRERFNSPAQFEQMMDVQYPEFGHCRRALYGPVWTDKTQQFARADVIVVGENGHRARGEYFLIREDGQFKIGGVRAERLPY